MAGDAVGFVSIIALFHDEVRRRLASTVVVSGLLPRFGTSFQSVEKLAEVIFAQLDS